MLAVWVNVIAVIAGSSIGLLFSNKISEKLSDIIQSAAGITTLVIGFQMAFQYKSIVILALSLIIGGLLGSWWDWDGKILALGTLIERMLKKTAVHHVPAENKIQWNFAYAFLNSSVLFCVGALAIVGSLKAGVEKDYTIIFTKSILDGFMAITFAAAMGPGTIFSSLAILLYQGALTLLSSVIKPFINETMIAELSASGGALIIMIGLGLLNLKKIKTANYLPAIFLAVLFAAIKDVLM